MIIESIKSTEIIEAGNFLRKVFDDSVSAEYSSAGVSHFYEMVTEQSIRERFLNGSRINVAKVDNRIAGYIEITGLNHIYLLFIRREFQNKGIGRKLIDDSLNVLRENNPELNKLTVNSTSFAVKIYEKLGFRKMADFQFKNGIMSYPMSLMINEDEN